MEIKTLKTFITVAALKNFSAAAKQLHTVQPNISRQISDLESELGVKLFIRNTREVNLTEMGKVLLPEAIEIIANNTRVINLIKTTKDCQLTLRIGYLASACSGFFPRLIRDFTTNYPDINITIREMSTKEQLSALLENQIDIGFSRPLSALENEQFHSAEIYTDSLVAAIPPHHPLENKQTLSFNDLKKENFILFKPEEALDVHSHVIANCEKNKFFPNIISHHGNIRSLMTAVSAGLGISIVPSCVKHAGLTECRFVAMEELTLTLQLKIYHGISSPQHVTDFVDFCLSKEMTLTHQINEPLD